MYIVGNLKVDGKFGDNNLDYELHYISAVFKKEPKLQVAEALQ